jgi:NADH dehydrogenase
MTVSADDVRRLHSAEGDAVLVLIEGRADVVTADQLASDEYRGALEVITRRDLTARLGDDPSDHELTEQAAILDAEVSELGG